MEEFPLVSIIIPVYNTKYFVEQCVHSVICQSYTHIEIILVDDGSTDGSSALCDKLSAEDNRIVVVHKENGGLSDARNTGVYKAKGRYLLFLDSDDFWMNKDGLLRLVEVANKKEYDFLCFNCSYYHYHKNKYKQWKVFSEKLLSSVCKTYRIKNLISSGTFPMSACLKLINRSFFLENHLFFQKGLYSEDIPWFINLLAESNNFGFVNVFMYAYRKGVATSISSSFSEKKYNDLMDILLAGLKDIQEGKWEKDIGNSLMSFWAYEYCILLGLSHFFKDDKIRRRKMDELRENVKLLNFHLNPKVHLISWLYKLFGFMAVTKMLHIYLKYILKISI